MTKVEFYEQIIANYALTEEEKDFLTHEKELVVKRNARKSTKPTKAQVANVAVKEAITNFLSEATEPLQAKAIGEGCGISAQKASALLKQLVEGGVVTKEVVKGKSLFSIA